MSHRQLIQIREVQVPGPASFQAGTGEAAGLPVHERQDGSAAEEADPKGAHQGLQSSAVGGVPRDVPPGAWQATLHLRNLHSIVDIYCIAIPGSSRRTEGKIFAPPGATLDLRPCSCDLPSKSYRLVGWLWVYPRPRQMSCLIQLSILGIPSKRF